MLGDEPVSALVRRQGAAVLATIHGANPTFIFAPHDVALAWEHADRTDALIDGPMVLHAPTAALVERDVVVFLPFIKVVATSAARGENPAASPKKSLAPPRHGPIYLPAQIARACGRVSVVGVPDKRPVNQP